MKEKELLGVKQDLLQQSFTVRSDTAARFTVHPTLNTLKGYFCIFLPGSHLMFLYRMWLIWASIFEIDLVLSEIGCNVILVIVKVRPLEMSDNLMEMIPTAIRVKNILFNQRQWCFLLNQLIFFKNYIKKKI